MSYKKMLFSVKTTVHLKSGGEFVSDTEPVCDVGVLKELYRHKDEMAKALRQGLCLSLSTYGATRQHLRKITVIPATCVEYVEFEVIVADEEGEV